jgi:hypothetical protein
MIVKTLRMPFRNQGGREVDILVADPKEGLTKAQVVAAQADIVTKNIFTSSGGDLIAALDPVILTQDTSALV